MSIGQAIISGMVQGLTEFFPISSSGHLVLLHSLFGLDKPQLEFDIVLHFGTLIAVVAYFWNDIVKLLTERGKKLWLVIIGTCPVIIIGLLVRNIVEPLFGMPKVAASLLLVTAVWLALAHLARLYYRKQGPKKLPTVIGSILIGMAQAAAILPGISRSGATISTGIILGVSGESAFEFSCLLSIPAIAGASLLKLRNVALEFHRYDILPFFLGSLIAAMVGYATLKMLSRIIRNHELYFFAIYCFAAGLAGLFIFK